MEWHVILLVGALSFSNAALALILIASNTFWARQVQTLTDKLMSRNFAEYNQVQNPPEKIQRVSLPLGEPEDFGTLPQFGIP